METCLKISLKSLIPKILLILSSSGKVVLPEGLWYFERMLAMVSLGLEEEGIASLISLKAASKLDL